MTCVKERRKYGSMQRISRAKKYCPLGKAVWGGRIGSHGPGAVLFPAHRHHSGHAGQAARHCLPGDGGGLRLRHERLGHGRGHRLRPPGAAPGAVFPGHGGLCRQRPGQRHPVRRQGGGRAAGGALHRRHRRRAGQGGVQGDENRHSGHTPGDHPGRSGTVRPAGPGHRHRGLRCGGRCQVGHRAPALLDGDSGVGGHRRGPYSAPPSA